MYWLLKSEPSSYSFDDLIRDKTTKWDGVRNYQARNNMKVMHMGDLGFFYHSAIKEPHIAGMMKVIKLYEPDPTAPHFGYVTVEILRPLKKVITLAQIKNHKNLQSMPLIKQSRLSVMPVTKEEWEIILGMES